MAGGDGDELEQCSATTAREERKHGEEEGNGERGGDKGEESLVLTRWRQEKAPRRSRRWRGGAVPSFSSAFSHEEEDDRGDPPWWAGLAGEHRLVLSLLFFYFCFIFFLAFRFRILIKHLIIL